MTLNFSGKLNYDSLTNSYFYSWFNDLTCIITLNAEKFDNKKKISEVEKIKLITHYYNL